MTLSIRVRKATKLCGLCALLLFLPGCWDYQRINYRDQVIGIGVDPVSGSPDQLLFTLQVPLFDKGGSQQGGQTVQKSSASSSSKEYRNYSVLGGSLNEALTKAQVESDRTFFVGNTETIVLNEHLTRLQVQGVVSELVRAMQVSALTSMVATPVSAHEVLETGSDSAPADTINRYDDTVTQVAYKTRGKLWTFWRDLNAVGIDPAVGVVRPESDRVKIAGTMVFEQTEPRDELGQTDTLSYNLLLGKARRFSTSVHDQNRTFTVYVFGSRCRRSAAFSKGGSPELHAKLHLWGIVVQDESKGTKELTKAEMERYERVMERQIQNQVQNTIRHLQRDHADIVGFGRTLLYEQPTLQQTIANQWNNLFSRAHVTVEVKASLVQKGRLM